MEHNEVGVMREQFARFLDYVNEQAAQAGLVSGLQSQVNELRERISQLEQQNYSLQQDLNDANSRIEQYKSEVTTQTDLHNRAVAHADALRHTIVEADARVSNLTVDLTNERDSHRITTANLEDSRRSVQEYEQRVQGYQADIGNLQGQVSEWRSKANAWEGRANELQSQLDGIKRVLSPTVVSGDVQSVG